jgi:hypothetical protein
MAFLAATERTLAAAWMNTVPTRPTSGMNAYLRSDDERE